MTKASPTLLLRHIRRLAEIGAASELSDRELVQKFVDQRDEDTFASLVRRHGPTVYGTIEKWWHDPIPESGADTVLTPFRPSTSSSTPFSSSNEWASDVLGNSGTRCGR
jgi:hypothetical protein